MAAAFFQDTWAAMEKLVEKGLVKNIGMSNFNSKQLADLMEECKILPSVLQVSPSVMLATETG